MILVFLSVCSWFREDTDIQFGQEVEVKKPVVRYLHICNQTAITTDFNLEMEMFSAVTPKPPPEVGKSR